MTAHIDYCEYKDRPFWRIHAYTVEREGDESVADANVAEKLVRALVCLDEGDGDADFFAYGEPPEGAEARFRVELRVTNTHRGHSDYGIAYRQLGPAPLEVIRAGMECYRDIKRNIKKARKRK